MPDVPITDVQVKKRFRRDLGDLNTLMASIRELGLLHPVVVNTNSVLIAGERRLEACKALGFDTIPVHVVDLEDLVRAEHDENFVRKDFLPSEAVAIKKALEPLERDRAKQRMREAGGVGGAHRKGGANLAHPSAGKTREKVAAAVGIGHITLKRAEEIVDAAQRDPEKFGGLVQEMDRTGRVSGVHRRLRVIQQAEELAREPPSLIQGRYNVIVADPPWRFDLRPDDMSRRNVTPYPTMALDDIKGMPVTELAADDSVLWLWTTNAHLPVSFEVVAAWGFTYKTTLTWVKNKMGTGDWLRGRTEHCILAVRGRPVITLTNQTTVLEGRVQDHSTKPEEFYELVESLCQGTKVELFARKARKGWDRC